MHSDMGINSLMFTITERTHTLVDADRGTLGEYYSEGDRCLRVLRMIIRSQERYQKHAAGTDTPRDDA